MTVFSLETIARARLIHHKKNMSLILIENTYCLLIRYGKSNVEIFAPYLMMHAPEYGKAAENIQTNTISIAKIPAKMNTWLKQPTARLDQLVDLIKQHKNRYLKFQTLLSLAIGTLGINEKEILIDPEKERLKMLSTTLNIKSNNKTIPYVDLLYTIAKNTFVVRNGRFQRIIDEEFYVVAKTPTAHEQLELEEKITLFAAEPLPQPTIPP